MSPGPEERQLIARVLVDDDRHAFAALVRLHQSAVRAFLARLTCGDRGLADDLAQETFLRAYRALGQFRGETALSSWLFGIAYRAFLSEARKKRFRAERPSADGVDVAGVEPARGDHVHLEQDLARAMLHLRDEERAAIGLCYKQDLSHDEAAQVMGIPVGTLKTHVARGKQKLQLHLAAWKDAPALAGRAQGVLA